MQAMASERRKCLALATGRGEAKVRSFYLAEEGSLTRNEVVGVACMLSDVSLRASEWEEALSHTFVIP